MSENTQLRVWHIPQVPGDPFYVPVSSVDEAVKVLTTLWDYDRFQLDQHIKPDYSSASGLEVFYEEDDEWDEWYSEDGAGVDIREFIEQREKE